MLLLNYLLLTYVNNIFPKLWGALKRGPCTCSMFKAFKCTYHRVIFMLTLYARTNVPLSSACTWTPFHHPQIMGVTNLSTKRYTIIVDYYNNNLHLYPSRNYWHEISLNYFVTRFIISLDLLHNNILTYKYTIQCN